jgi:hypothetical protein
MFTIERIGPISSLPEDERQLAQECPDDDRDLVAYWLADEADRAERVGV